MNEIARRTDLDTSKEAAEYMNASGQRKRLMRSVYAWLHTHPGSSSRDIAEGLGLEHAQVWKRVSDLRNKNLVFPWNRKTDPVTGRRVYTWHTFASTVWDND